ncbi:MAG: hypothetical protein ACRYGP_06035 [Janthinobacterium lividum]
MRSRCSRTLTLALLAATPWIAMPAFAGSPYYPSDDARGTVAMRKMVRKGPAGHYSCGFNELHTRLERKNCR